MTKLNLNTDTLFTRLAITAVALYGFALAFQTVQNVGLA
jgi:hypothetical protein